MSNESTITAHHNSKLPSEALFKYWATIVALLGGLVGLYTFVTSTQKNLEIAAAEEARAIQSEEHGWARAAVYGLVRDSDFAGVSIEDLRSKYQNASIAQGKELKTPKIRSNETLDKILLELIADNAVTRNVYARYMVVAMPHMDPKLYEAGNKIGKIYEKAFAILKEEPGENDARMLHTKIQLQLTAQNISGLRQQAHQIVRKRLILILEFDFAISLAFSVAGTYHEHVGL